MRNALESAKLNYIRNLFGHSDPAFADVAKALSAREYGMQLRPEEGRMVECLLAMIQAKNVVEIGSLVGFSTSYIARAVGEEGMVYALEQDAASIKRAKSYLKEAGYENRVHFLEGKALESLPLIGAKAPFDAIFIDADKGGYVDYLDWAEKHIRKGGLIIGDNTFLFGAVYQDTPPEGVSKKSWQAMREFNARLADPSRYCSMLVPTEEGMTVAVKL